MTTIRVISSIDVVDVGKIDKLIKSGKFASRSHAVRYIVKYYLGDKNLEKGKQ